MPDLVIIVISFLIGMTAGWVVGWHLYRPSVSSEELENALHIALNSSIQHDELTEGQAQNLYNRWMDVSGLSDVWRRAGIKCGCGNVMLHDAQDWWLDDNDDVLHTTEWCDTVDKAV